MDRDLLQDVLSKVYRRYPELNGLKPNVRKQRTAKQQASDRGATYTLTFKKSVHADTSVGTKSIPQITRITVNDRGAILKVSSSR